VAGSCKNGCEISDSIKCRKFFDLLRNFWIVKDSAQVVNYLVNKYQEK